MKNPQLKRLSIDEVELDISNPRIAKYLEHYGEDINAEQIALALGVGDTQTSESSTTFLSLKASIKTNGGVIHPIIVNKKENGKYLVIEGNTRVAIYREFREDPRIKGEWTIIPALVYDSLSQPEVDAIRLQAHLVGTREWDAYSKAKYLDQLYNSENLPISQIVDFCGGNRTEVMRYIDGYRMMEKNYRSQLPSDDEFDTTRFSAFVEFQNRRIKEAVIDAGFNERDFAKWVIEQKFVPLRTIRDLPKILGYPKSREIFIKQKRRAAEKALKAIIIETPNTALKESSLFQLVRELTNRILNLRYEEVQNLKSEAESDEVQDLLELKEQVVELCADVISD